ncbi:PREDICTED: formin-like protein 18 isoform X3 [Ipomoea nil]|uniref:formin-like protein 18 isoform X3 n=1 Tax=Ipomoea nil TaxID=35883 RepID=UPI00090113F2|nr:PREDICTED: formin-like protein 18 isoform X3 [Ipomoea nil]
MSLLRKFFYKKPPEGLLEISERVFVFDCCFSTDMVKETEYKSYMGGVVGKLCDHFPDASIMVFNFKEGDNQSPLETILNDYEMTVVNYPRQYENCPVLTMEMIHHFVKSTESWLSIGTTNMLLMHCEHGGWPLLSFMLAAFLIYRKQFNGEQKTLDMMYKQGPRELLHLMTPLNPLPSQLRYLQYVSRKKVEPQWPPADKALTLDCVILRLIPNIDGKGGCRPIFRIYGQDPFKPANRTSKLLFSTGKNSKSLKHRKQSACELVKIDIDCHVLGDVVLECITLDDDLEREQMMFRVMFNTSFIRSNVLMLNRDEIDILWNVKDQFPKDFRAEILFSEMDSSASNPKARALPSPEEKGLPVEAFDKCKELFSDVDWPESRDENQKSTRATNTVQEKSETSKEKPVKTSDQILKNEKMGTENNITEKVKGNDSREVEQTTSSSNLTSQGSAPPPATPHVSSVHSASIVRSRPIRNSASLNASQSESLSCSGSGTNPPPPPPCSESSSSPQQPPPCLESKSTPLAPPSVNSMPTPPPPPGVESTPIPPPPANASPPPPPAPSSGSASAPPPPPPSSDMGSNDNAMSSAPAAAPTRPPPLGCLSRSPAVSMQSNSSSKGSIPPPPGAVGNIPPPPGAVGNIPPPPGAVGNIPPPPGAKSIPPPPGAAGNIPPPPGAAGNIPPPPGGKGSIPPPPGGKGGIPPPPGAAAAQGGNPPPPPGAKGKLPAKSVRSSPQTKRTPLKPYHWLKLTRVTQGSLWAETQKPEEAAQAPEFNMSELEVLFSATVPDAGRRNGGGKSGQAAGAKSEKVHLIDLRRAYNCEIMLTKVKIPLPDLMSSVLALDDSALDIDQVENLIKFCPTKEEMELLKNFKGEKENLGKCEQFFLELMKVPRVESKLRVFSFKIQFCCQVSELTHNLNIVNSASEEVRGSIKLRRIMQTILSLGNALNQGTARGSAVGFRLDSLLKLTDTRSRNNKMNLMHYLCKVLAERLPELLTFYQDLAHLEAATKIQLKILAEEMQAISKGLEKVVQELAASENDGPVSDYFCKSLKMFLKYAEKDVKSVSSLYSEVGRNCDALPTYFGEDPARCPFEQAVATLLNFTRMFRKAHEENVKQAEFERKKALKEAELEKQAAAAAAQANTAAAAVGS